MIEHVATKALRGAIESTSMMATDMIFYASRKLGVNDDTYEPDAYSIAYTFLAIVSVLVGLIILLEAAKDLLVYFSDKYTRPILVTLFGDIAVLGLVSLIAFASNAYGGIELISDEVYGNQNYLVGLLENFQYALFLAMVLLVIQVFMLARLGNAFVKSYTHWNEKCVNGEVEIRPVMDDLEVIGPLSVWGYFGEYFKFGPVKTWKRHSKIIENEELVQFYALRREFILNRSAISPLKVPSEYKWLPANFDYASYQALSLSKFLVAIVAFTPLTWASLWTLLVVTFAFMLIVDGQYLYLAIVWGAIGYFSLGFVYVQYRKSQWIIEKLLNPAFLRTKDSFPYEPWRKVLLEPDKEVEDKQLLGKVKGARRHKRTQDIKKVPLDEADRLNIAFAGKGILDTTTVFTSGPSGPVEGVESVDSKVSKEAYTSVMRVRAQNSFVPGWVFVDKTKAGFFSKLLYGGKAQPNKQHMLMWGDLAGPDLQCYLLRVFLIIQSIYIALVAIYFTPYMYNNYGDVAGSFYLILALLPEAILYLEYYPSLIMNMSHVSSTGLLKDQQIVQEVIRAQEGQKLVRTLLMLTKLKAASKKQKRQQAGYTHKTYNLQDARINAKVTEFARVFDAYDPKKTGKVTLKELGLILKSMGMSLSEQELQHMFVLLDLDNDGIVSKEEFIEWNMENVDSNPVTTAAELKAFAKTIFVIFDEEGTGLITTEEFKRSLDQLNSGLSSDEIAAVIRDFDADNDGTISLEDLEAAIEKGVHGE